MTRIREIKTTFTAGEVSDELLGRGDPNFRKLQNVDESDLYFATALRIARRAVIDAIEDPTGGATHYHAAGISPYWAKRETPTAVIGNHIFYYLV